MRQLREGVSRPQLVQIVNEQDDWFALIGELRKDHFDQLVRVECSGPRGLRLGIDGA